MQFDTKNKLLNSGPVIPFQTYYQRLVRKPSSNVADSYEFFLISYVNMIIHQL